MLGVYVYVHVVAIMLFCSCKGLKVGKDLFLRRWRIVYIIVFCIGFCSGFRFLFGFSVGFSGGGVWFDFVLIRLLLSSSL